MDVVFLSTVLPTIILTGGGVVGIWLVTRTWLKYKGNPTSAELERLADSIEMLQHSVDDLRHDVRKQLSDVRELSGRVEFTERLLAEPGRGENH